MMVVYRSQVFKNVFVSFNVVFWTDLVSCHYPLNKTFFTVVTGKSSSLVDVVLFVASRCFWSQIQHQSCV